MACSVFTIPAKKKFLTSLVKLTEDDDENSMKMQTCSSIIFIIIYFASLLICTMIYIYLHLVKFISSPACYHIYLIIFNIRILFSSLQVLYFNKIITSAYGRMRLGNRNITSIRRYYNMVLHAENQSKAYKLEMILMVTIYVYVILGYSPTLIKMLTDYEVSFLQNHSLYDNICSTVDSIVSYWRREREPAWDV